MPQIISDLAYILIIAGIVTIIFKKLRPERLTFGQKNFII